MALGLDRQVLVYGPFAAAIVFGLAVASVLTLFVVPTLYLGLEDLKAALRQPAGHADIRHTRQRHGGSVPSGSAFSEKAFYLSEFRGRTLGYRRARRGGSASRGCSRAWSTS